MSTALAPSPALSILELLMSVCTYTEEQIRLEDEECITKSMQGVLVLITGEGSRSQVRRRPRRGNRTSEDVFGQ